MFLLILICSLCVIVLINVIFGTRLKNLYSMSDGTATPLCIALK